MCSSYYISKSHIHHSDHWYYDTNMRVWVCRLCPSYTSNILLWVMELSQYLDICSQLVLFDSYISCCYWLFLTNYLLIFDLLDVGRELVHTSLFVHLIGLNISIHTMRRYYVIRPSLLGCYLSHYEALRMVLACHILILASIHHYFITLWGYWPYTWVTSCNLYNVQSHLYLITNTCQYTYYPGNIMIESPISYQLSSHSVRG